MTTKWHRLAFALVCVSCAMSACGGDEELSPEEQCLNVGSAHCNRLAECAKPFFTGANQERLFVQECESEFSAGFCSRATGVSSFYDQCLTDLPHAVCQLEIEPSGQVTPDLSVPNSCRDVIAHR